MCSYSEEMFLRDYFTFDSVVGKFCDGKAIFDSLAQIYFIDRARAEQLFALATSDKIRNIATLKNYKLYRRMRQYSEACGLKTNYADVEDDILTIKGQALYITSNCGLSDAGNGTKASVYADIVEKSKAGQVTALRIYGVLQCEGIFFEQCARDGLKNLTRAARWNSIESVLALLKYDAANSNLYTDMLYTLAVGTPFEEVFLKTSKLQVAREPKKIKECILLSKVFGRGQITPNAYLPVYANLLYSEIIPFKDKETLLLSESKESIISYMDLPLKLTKRKFSHNVSAITDLSLSRAEEQNSIVQNALNSDIRHYSSFKPLCLCSDSRYMRNYYAAAIEKLFNQEHVEKISVSDLSPRDFEPDMNNVFVRSCNEDKGNVFIISFVGEINEQTAKFVCDFLQGSKRSKMHLVRPNVEIDLSSVLPVCFCDKSNAQMLAKYCDKVDVASPTQEEMQILLRELISEKENQYCIKRLSIEADVLSKLCSVSIDTADTALDIAIAANRNGERQLTLTEENTNKFIKKCDTTRGYGYGGRKNDN